jgi:hypothetical protein
MRKIILLLLPILLFACTLSGRVPSPDPVTAAPVTESPYQPCAFNWATQALPELSAKVQAAMDAADLEDVTASAEAFGETCSTGQANETPSFGAMETDFRVYVRVTKLTDLDDLGNTLEKILTVLDQFPPGTTPGPQAGYVGVTFATAEEDLNLWFHAADGKAARDQGLHGAALLEKLHNK